MKVVKFSAPLVPLVLSGEKNVTWRLWDDKNLTAGDELSLVKRPEMTEFAKAEITEAYEKKMGEIIDDDLEGHEKFSSKEEMYKTYSKYYDLEVNAGTPVKIVRFKLL
jgi:hypothetical protein